MLASQGALCLFTGSLEMLVFHTLSAGNIGHLGAPGTGVVSTVAPPGRAGSLPGLPDVPLDSGGVLDADAAAQPARQVASTIAAASRRPARQPAKCPVSHSIVES